jgi:hypothetical protein
MLAGKHLEQFNFETLPPALDGETSLLSSSVSCCAATAEASFAYACGAGGGYRRQSISTFSMLKCSKALYSGRAYYKQDTLKRPVTQYVCFYIIPALYSGFRLSPQV